MWVAWIGFVFLAAMTLLNVTAPLANFFLYDTHLPTFTIPLAKLVLALLGAVLIVSFFFKKSRLSTRLPRPIPGKWLMMTGVILWLGIPALIAVEIKYFGTSHLGLLGQYGLATFPAYVCFLLGCGRMLLAVDPRA